MIIDKFSVGLCLRRELTDHTIDYHIDQLTDHTIDDLIDLFIDIQCYFMEGCMTFKVDNVSFYLLSSINMFIDLGY